MGRPKREEGIDMKKSVKLVIAGIILVAVIVFFIVSSTKPLAVEGFLVKKQDVEQTFKEEGIVISENEKAIYPQNNGEVIELFVTEGQNVKTGDKLLKISTQDLDYRIKQLNGQLLSLEGEEKRSYAQPYQSQISQQQAVINGLKQQQADRQKDYSRAEEDYKNMKVTVDVLDQYKRLLDETSNMLKQQQEALSVIRERAAPLSGTGEYFKGLKATVQAQIDQVNQQIAKSVVNAPYDGVIKTLAVKRGTVANTGAALMTISGSGALAVETYVLPENAVLLKTGTDVQLVQKRNDEDAKFSGKVKIISSSALEKTSALGLAEQRVRVVITPSSEAVDIKVGYNLDATFKVSILKDCLVIPKSAVFSDKDKDVVWVIKNDQAKLVTIKKGMATEDNVVVEKGLKEGDAVIKNPELNGLKEGAKIKATY